MSGENGTPTPPDDLSEELIQQIESLKNSELESLLAYIEGHIESHSTPTVAEIQEDAAGEVLEVETHGEYAHVETHPPDPDGTGVDADIISLYHVRREPELDGTESLHWAFLGDMRDTAGIRCETCGRTFDHEIEVCPYCGSDDIDSETEE